MNYLRIALAQLTSTEDVDKNILQMSRCLDEGEAKGPIDLFCFPENSLFLRVSKTTPIRYFTVEDLAQSALQKKIDQMKFPVHVTLPMIYGSTRCNATVLMEAHRVPQILYQKIHLFDVDVPGAPPVRESDNFSPGHGPVIWTLNGWKLGLTICFDLRFAEQFLYYGKAKVDAILVPSAFLVPTGQAHWHVLLRARAIESQCYVIAPAQAGDHRSGDQVRQTFGHSLAVDPWGRVLVDIEGTPEVAIVELKQDEIAKVRRQIPM